MAQGDDERRARLSGRRADARQRFVIARGQRDAAQRRLDDLRAAGASPEALDAEKRKLDDKQAKVKGALQELENIDSAARRSAHVAPAPTQDGSRLLRLYRPRPELPDDEDDGQG
jgi:hypothetical protein